MGWFDEQIKQRKLNDNQVFSDSFESIAGAITGHKRNQDKLDISKDAINTILRSYGYHNKNEIPKEIDNIHDQIEYLCHPFGLMNRSVRLTPGWYKDSVGAILAFRKEDETPVALLPSFSGYRFLQNGKYVFINKNNEEEFGEFGLCFYKPYPNRKITPVDLVKFAFESYTTLDIVMIFVFMGVSTAIGLLTPKLSYFLYGEVIENKSLSLLFSTVFFYLCLNISNLLFSLYQSMYNSITSTKMSISVQAAAMMRVLSLPPNFFRKYSSGELSQRISYITSLSNTLVSMILNTGFTSLFSLAYIGSIFKYAPNLVIPSLIIIAVTITFSIFTSLVQTRISKQNMEISSKESGLTYAMVSGIRKIRLSGAEKRAFARWANLYAKSVENTYNPPTFIKINGVITTAISLISNLVMYSIAIKSNIGVAEYNAFTSAYGMVFGAFSSMASIALSVAQIKPIMDMAKPLMDAVPEISENKEVLTKINGNIELNNVSFRYDENMPFILDDLSLKIKEGQYIAIVGKTGCGKSTFIRLLLGFEKPLKGSIYYDGKDLNSLDLKSLRRKIGVVMQDGKLFQGDIYSNITISAPWLTMDDAWAAAEIAGIKQDIENMPMGMNTLLSEGSGGISGGQRQRLLIARAIAPKPKVLIFDEATSALDNITQKKVAEALDDLKCTRIVIAHRLSTIRHCDRILYLENGKIKEDGTYEELIAKNGLFASLVERQRLDIGEK